MKNIFRIVVSFFILLISYIHLGFLNDSVFQKSLTETNRSFPLSDNISLQDIFICPAFVSPYDNAAPGKTENYSHNIKFQWTVKAIPTIIKDNHFPPKAQDQNPSLLTDIFSAPDIGFPFDYFW